MGSPMQTPGVAMTYAFATLTLARLFHGFNCRTRQSILRVGFTSNPYSIGAFAAGVLLLGLVLTIPPLQGLFSISGITGWVLLKITGLAILPTVCIQMIKMVREWKDSRENRK